MGRWLFRTIFRAETRRRRYALDHAHQPRPGANGIRQPVGCVNREEWPARTRNAHWRA